MEPTEQDKSEDQEEVVGHKSRTTQAILELRVQEVLRIRLDGAEGWDVRRYVAEKEKAREQPWTIQDGDNPLSIRQIRRYVEAADKLISESCREEREELISRHMAQRRSVYAMAIKAKNLKAALAALADLAKLQDLYPAAKTKNEITGADGGPQEHKMTGDVNLHVDQGAIRDFKADCNAAGLDDVPRDGPAEPVDQEGADGPA